MTVSERDVLRAMFYLWSRLKIVVEPAGSLSLAPLLAGMLPLSGKRIGLLISGGNIDIGRACNIFKDC
jgi:threonine dehydratase